MAFTHPLIFEHYFPCEVKNIPSAFVLHLAVALSNKLPQLCIKTSYFAIYELQLCQICEIKKSESEYMDFTAHFVYIRDINRYFGIGLYIELVSHALLEFIETVYKILTIYVHYIGIEFGIKDSN